MSVRTHPYAERQKSSHITVDIMVEPKHEPYRDASIMIFGKQLVRLTVHSFALPWPDFILRQI